MLEKIGRLYGWCYWWCPPMRRHVHRHAKGYGIAYILMVITNTLTWKRQLEFWDKIFLRTLGIDHNDPKTNWFLGHVDGEIVLKDESWCIKHRVRDCFECGIEALKIDQEGRDQQEV